MGALGQIVALMARASGAKVIAIDLHDSRLQLARELGTEITLNAARDTPAEAIKALTSGIGADACIEVTGSTRALHEAILGRDRRPRRRLRAELHLRIVRRQNCDAQCSRRHDRHGRVDRR